MCARVEIGAPSMLRFDTQCSCLDEMLPTLDLNEMIAYGVEHQLKNHMSDFVRVVRHVLAESHVARLVVEVMQAVVSLVGTCLRDW